VLAWPLRFQDANFPHRLSLCWSRAEGLHRRWVPYGMPRLGSSFERSVFFLYATDGNSGKQTGPNGTGVLVSLPASGGASRYEDTHLYAVTCQHLAPRGSSILRINTAEGESRTIKTHPDDWQWIPGGDDIAAIDLTERLNQPGDTISFIPKSLFATKTFIAEVELGIAEDGFMLGLFADLPGEKRNLVAARSGNLSLLADDDTPVMQGHKAKHPSHIFDMRSRPGFSGSPVFVYRTQSGDLRKSVDYEPPPRVTVWTERVSTPEDDAQWQRHVDELAKNQFIRFLGIHAAQYHDRVIAYKTKTPQAEANAAIREGDQLRIPNSMAVVVPAWEVLTLLDLPLFQERRRQREDWMIEKKRKSNDPEPESVAENSLPSDDTEANPRHREDFMRLVDAAARKRPRGGQT
jgi:hypothetical protein